MEENEFTNLVNKYNNSLWKIFKKEIDEAIKVCEEKKFDNIKSYCHIIGIINNKYAKYKYAITGDDRHSVENDDGFRLLPDDVLERIFKYINPYFDNCYVEIRKYAIKKVYNIREMQERDQIINKIFEIAEIRQFKDCFDSRDFDEEINTK